MMILDSGLIFWATLYMLHIGVGNRQTGEVAFLPTQWSNRYRSSLSLRLSQCIPTFLACYPKSHPDVGFLPATPNHARTTIFFTEMPTYSGCTPN